MATCKGTDVNTVVLQIMSKLIADDLMAQFSLKGKRKKRCFNALVNFREAINGNILHLKFHVILWSKTCSFF